MADFGLQNAATIFLIPGGPGFGPGYLQRQRFTDHGFNAFAIDFNHLGIESISQMVDHVEMCVSKSNSKKNILLGHSFGAAVAIEVALRNRIGLDLLILSNWIYDIAWSENYKKNHHHKFRDGADTRPVLESDEMYQAETLQYLTLYFSGRENQEDRAIFERISYDIKLRRAIHSTYLATLDLKAVLGHILVPVLSISSMEDEVTTPAYVQAGESLIHNCSSLRISNSGHFPFIDNSEEFFGALKNASPFGKS